MPSVPMSQAESSSSMSDRKPPSLRRSAMSRAPALPNLAANRLSLRSREGVRSRSAAAAPICLSATFRARVQA